MDNALLIPMLGGIAIALMAGPYGCFVVWQRLAYFSETIAHAALLGLALGTAFHIPTSLAIALVACCIAVVMVSLQRESRFSNDGILGLLAHASLAFGVVALSLQGDAIVHGDHTHAMDPHALEAILFGDISALTMPDLTVLAMVSAGLVCMLLLFWKRMLRRALDRTIASTVGECPVRSDAVFTILLALVVAFAFQWVGILLITSLLIIPALAARLIAHSPTQMALLACGIGCVSVVTGLLLAESQTLPATPSIVVVATGVFVLLYGVSAIAKPKP